MKKTKFKDIQGGAWVIDLLDKLHPDYKDAEVHAVETKHLPDGSDQVITRYRLLIREKDGTTSFIGDGSKPFEYPTMTLAERDLKTFKKWQRNEL